MRSIYKKFYTVARNHWLIAAALLASAVYLPLLNAYFQQDEWFAFGYFFANSNEGVIHLLKLAFAPNVGHFTPLYYVFFYVLTAVFGVNYQAFLITSLIWHLAVFFLLFQMVKLLTKNKRIALLTSTLFVYAASSSQATSWVVADTNTHGATFFGILALYLAIYFLTKKNMRTQTSISFLLLSIGSIFISLFFKEVTVGVFASVFLLTFIIKTTTVKRNLVIASSILSGILYVILRVIMFLLPQAASSASLITQTQTTGLIVYNAVTFPAKAFFQAFLPAEFWLLVGRTIGRVLPHQWEVNTSQFSTTVNEKILEPLFILCFVVVIIFTVRRYKRLRTSESKVMIWAILFVTLNSIIYAFSPERTGIITFLDSRNLYFSSIGSFLWISALLHKRIQRNNALSGILIMILFILQFVYLKRQFSNLILSSQARKTILSQIFMSVPSLPQNTVFFVSSDTSYYGLSKEHTTPPFQSGFGHTLLVLYTKNHPYPAEFYESSFLWPLGSEGYKSIEDNAFGYYGNFNSLLSAVKAYNIPVENVYSFSWQGGTDSLINTTNEVRSRLTNQK